jgi:ribosome-interacting GTPase 1
MGILEKISEIEKEIARTQKNKGEVHFRLELGRVASANFVIILHVLHH